MKKSKRIKMGNLMSELAYKLIMDGAKVLQPPKFLGGNRQSNETVLQIGHYKGKVKIYHRTPFHFIIEPDGWPAFIQRQKI